MHNHIVRYSPRYFNCSYLFNIFFVATLTITMKEDATGWNKDGWPTVCIDLVVINWPEKIHLALGRGSKNCKWLVSSWLFHSIANITVVCRNMALSIFCDPKGHMKVQVSFPKWKFPRPRKYLIGAYHIIRRNLISLNVFFTEWAKVSRIHFGLEY